MATVFAQDEYPETRLDLNPGDTLVLCTDGLVEHPGQDISVGLDALDDAVRSGPTDTGELADHLCALLLGQTGPDDDMALLLLRRVAAPGVHASRRMVQHIHQADPEGLVESRMMLRQALAAWGAAAVSPDIELAADELLTNALVHTDGGAILTAELLAPPVRRIRLEIQDRSSEWPHRRAPGETATSGRGLMIVDALAANWGVEPRGTGKSVWCEFVL